MTDSPIDVPAGAEFGQRIYAAGVVALRGEGERTQVLALYRPHRDDWSLPKGKLDPGEMLAACAVRETMEETGLRVTLGAPLPTARYTVLDRKSDSPLYARKSVNYWLARIEDEAVAVGDADLPDGWAPNDEVSELRWVALDRVHELLTYTHDVEVVHHAASTPRDTVPFIVLRHATAEKRVEYRARVGAQPDDALRPLNERGLVEAQALADVLAAYGVEDIASSSATRCTSTVAPYAERTGQEVETFDTLTEEAFARKPVRAVRDFARLIERSTAGVVCVHRPTLPTYMELIGEVCKRDAPDGALKPAEFVVLHRSVTRRNDGSLKRVRLGRSTIIEHGYQL